MFGVCSIFILLLLKDELDCCLCGCGQDSEEVIVKWMVQVVVEMSYYVEYDYLIVNDDFDIVLSDLKNIICVECLCMSC